MTLAEDISRDGRVAILQLNKWRQGCYHCYSMHFHKSSRKINRTCVTGHEEAVGCLLCYAVIYQAIQTIPDMVFKCQGLIFQ